MYKMFAKRPAETDNHYIRLTNYFWSQYVIQYVYFELADNFSRLNWQITNWQ